MLFFLIFFSFEESTSLLLNQKDESSKENTLSQSLDFNNSGVLISDLVESSIPLIDGIFVLLEVGDSLREDFNQSGIFWSIEVFILDDLSSLRELSFSSREDFNQSGILVSSKELSSVSSEEVSSVGGIISVLGESSTTAVESEVFSQEEELSSKEDFNQSGISVSSKELSSV